MEIKRESTSVVLVKYSLVLLIILNSKTVFFGIVHNDLTQLALIGWFMLGLFFLKIDLKSVKINLMRCALILIFIMLSVMLNFNDMGSSHFNIVIVLVINIILMSLIGSQFRNYEFSKVYVNLMCAIASISLICFSLAIFSPSIASKLVTSFEGKYVLSPFYMWGWGRIASRNAGPFWEPGAYQSFLVMALLMILLILLPNIQNVKKLRILKFQFVLLCITLLTTQSTTTYILFILLFIAFFSEIKKLFLVSSSKKGRLLKGYIIFLLVISGILYVLSSNNINDKFSGMGNEYSSVEIRMNDTTESFELIQLGGLFGIGKTYHKENLEAERNMVNNSNGLLNMTYTYGLAFAAVYIFFYKNGIDNFFSIKNSNKKYVLYLIFIVFHSTEGFYWLSVFLLFLFEPIKYKQIDNNLVEEIRTNGERKNKVSSLSHML